MADKLIKVNRKHANLKIGNGPRIKFFATETSKPVYMCDGYADTLYVHEDDFAKVTVKAFTAHRYILNEVTSTPDEVSFNTERFAELGDDWDKYIRMWWD